MTDATGGKRSLRDVFRRGGAAASKTEAFKEAVTRRVGELAIIGAGGAVASALSFTILHKLFEIVGKPELMAHAGPSALAGIAMFMAGKIGKSSPVDRNKSAGMSAWLATVSNLPITVTLAMIVEKAGGVTDLATCGIIAAGLVSGAFIGAYSQARKVEAEEAALAAEPEVVAKAPVAHAPEDFAPHLSPTERARERLKNEARKARGDIFAPPAVPAGVRARA